MRVVGLIVIGVIALGQFASAAKLAAGMRARPH
jgi:hypothetical protein